MADKHIAHDGDQLIIDIDKKLEAVKATAELSAHIIQKVPEHVRSVNVKAYEPVMIAIGPFTYDLRSENHLKGMEEHKRRYLKGLLQRKGKESAKGYVTAIRRLEGRARSCYSEPISTLSSDQFVEMMLLDACFIVELFRYVVLKQWDGVDPIFNLPWILKKLGRDLLLVENQLPFFVLQEFYDMTKTPEEEVKINFDALILVSFNWLLPYPLLEGPKFGFMGEEINHLLCFIHDYYWVWRPRPVTIQVASSWKFIGCATELEKAGIKFERIIINQKLQSMFDIDFDQDKGIMTIPSLKIDDDTESLIRNLVAYEQSSFVTENSPFVSYVKLMSCLINTRKDVKIFSDGGIFENWLGDDEAVAKMINRLGVSVKLIPYNYYGEIFEAVNTYCHSRFIINRWLACLDYFKTTPWAVISFCAALFLLILTVAQTVFSVLACFR